MIKLEKGMTVVYKGLVDLYYPPDYKVIVDWVDFVHHRIFSDTNGNYHYSMYFIPHFTLNMETVKTCLP